MLLGESYHSTKKNLMLIIQDAYKVSLAVVRDENVIKSVVKVKLVRFAYKKYNKSTTTANTVMCIT